MDYGGTHAERMTEFNSLSDEIVSHPAQAMKRRWFALRRVYAGVLRNAAELSETLTLPSDGELLAVQLFAQTDDGDKAREVFLNALYRQLANYLSISGALVDFSRQLRTEYAGTQFISEYEQRLKTLSGAPVSQFLRDLRNYVLHHDVPPFHINLRQGLDGKLALKVTLDPAKLLDSHKWKTQSRTYIEARQEIPLLDVLEEHQSLTHALYEWMFSMVYDMHKKEIRELNSLVERHNNFW